MRISARVPVLVQKVVTRVPNGRPTVRRPLFVGTGPLRPSCSPTELVGQEVGRRAERRLAAYQDEIRLRLAAPAVSATQKQAVLGAV